MFKDDLLAGAGNVTVWINSPGGDVFAAAQIYNMLMDYTWKITVKIDGLRQARFGHRNGVWRRIYVPRVHADDP